MARKPAQAGHTQLFNHSTLRAGRPGASCFWCTTTTNKVAPVLSLVVILYVLLPL
jgi:hypothetical protein